MSFCPHRLLRSRFRAGLPTCFPQQRLRLKHGSRQRWGTLTARYFADSASPAQVAVSDDIANELRLAYGRYSTPSESTDPTAPFSTTDPHSHQDLEDFIVDEEEDETPYRLSDDSAPEPRGNGGGVVHEEVHRVAYFDIKDGQILRKRTRLISRELMARELRIRQNSLFSNGETVYHWRRARNELYQARSQNRDPKEEIVAVDLTEEDRALLAKIREDSQSSLRDTWEGLTKEEKTSHWNRLSLWMMRNSPELLPAFLLVTCQSAEKPVFMMVSDCILFLATLHPETLKKRRNFLKTCMHPSTWPVLFLPQKGVRFYLKTVGRDAVYEAFEVVRSKRIHLKAQTCLCFMSRLTEFKDIDKALEMLGLVRTLDQSDLSMDSNAVLRHCCKLLMLDYVVDHEGERNFRILPRLLELGVRPNREMMNIVLSNALKTGDPQLGLDVLDYMREQGISPDSYTYVSLLTDALARLDRARFESLLQEIKPHAEFQRNPWILSKVLHYHYVFTAKNIDPDENPKAIFAAMLDIYTTVHDITPLKDLSIVPPNYTPPPGMDKSAPSTVALYIIIATYLRCQKHISSSKVVYSRFRSLVLQGHESIAPLAATDHMYNEFLVAFRNDPRGLRPAVHLVEDMLQSSSKGVIIDKNAGSSPIVHSNPSFRTWTLLMSVFIYNSQPLAAEKVSMMMNKHGVKFNQVTWNTIINGLANQQNIPKIAKAIKEMEGQGFVIDDYTMKSLRYLRDPERLWVAMEELDQLPNPSPEGDNADAKVQVKDAELLLDKGLRRLKANLDSKI